MKALKSLSLAAFTLAGIVSTVAYLRYRPTAFGMACTEKLEAQKYEKSQASGLCGKLESKFFAGKSPIQPISPSLVGSPPLPIDDKVKFISFFDPNYLASYAYCYFAFRGWFDPKTMSPRQIALAASGFAILKSELNGYADWLKGSSGQDCTRSVRESVGMDPADLDAEMGDRVSIIAFNPVGAIRSDEGMDSVLREAFLTINHERIHAIHVSCPQVEAVAAKEWDALTPGRKEELKKAHLNYDWSNRVVAVREAFAYRLEEKPEEVLAYLGECKLVMNQP